MSARRWKADLQLNLKGKAGSRELAQSIFPTAHDLLRCVMAWVSILTAAVATGLHMCAQNVCAFSSKCLLAGSCTEPVQQPTALPFGSRDCCMADGRPRAVAMSTGDISLSCSSGTAFAGAGA